MPAASADGIAIAVPPRRMHGAGVGPGLFDDWNSITLPSGSPCCDPVMKIRPLLLAIVAFLALPVATAAGLPVADRLAALEARMREMEADAEALRRQVAAAEDALQEARAEIESLKAAPPVAAEPATVAAAATGDAGGGNGNAFNPAITVILNGSVSRHSLDPDGYLRAGFPLMGEGGPGDRGISLGESEVALAANIDDKFYGQLTLAVESEDGEDGIGIEEAYIETLALPNGFNLRAGRFFSNIGYLNGHHAHTDKFFDRPLAYQAFLGGQYGDDGLQLRWLAPTEVFLELGGEVFRGTAASGTGTHSLFAHAGGDLGDNTAWLAGVSMLASRVEEGEDGFSGDSRLYVADVTWKWAPQGNFKDGGITLRGEYFIDRRDGEYVDPEGIAPAQTWEGTRRGAYVEGVYRINRQWEAGYRYDRLRADDSGPYASSFDPRRHSLVLTWINSEFSLLRLQYSRDEANASDTDHVLSLQYQTSLGAHGAHKF